LDIILKDEVGYVFILPEGWGESNFRFRSDLFEADITVFLKLIICKALILADFINCGRLMAKIMLLRVIGKLQFGHCGIFVNKYIK